MKRHLLLTCFLLGSLFCGTNAFAQFGYQNGYGFGAGFNFGFPMMCRSGFQRDDIPYFAKFPPVYYSNIVRRPYGVSPFAAPPGIVPVEMAVPSVSREPLTIINPFYTDPADANVSDQPVESNSSSEGVMPLIPNDLSTNQQTGADASSETNAGVTEVDEGSNIEETTNDELKDD